MKRTPFLFTNIAPLPLTDSEITSALDCSTVGLVWIYSISTNSAPAFSAITIPLPSAPGWLVVINPFKSLRYFVYNSSLAANPPVAITTALEEISRSSFLTKSLAFTPSTFPSFITRLWASVL